jgi:hypothetical protein
LKEWGADDFVIAAQEAAAEDHIEILKLFKDWGLKDFDNVIKKATENGNFEILKMLREWDVATADTDFYSYIPLAYDRSVTRFLLKWQASLTPVRYHRR